MTVSDDTVRNDTDRVVPVREAAKILGKDPTTLWRWERSGAFISRRRFGPGSVGYLASEFNEWLQSRPKVNGQGGT